MARIVTTRGTIPAFINALFLTPTDDCVIWPFSTTNKGYGDLTLDGKRRYAHRFICERAHGLAPFPGAEAAHSCGRGKFGCVNPSHLAWKTRQENSDDKLAHGTRVMGSKSGRSKLHESDVIALRALAGTATHRDLAEQFGIVQSMVTRILNRNIWRHI